MNVFVIITDKEQDDIDPRDINVWGICSTLAKAKARAEEELELDPEKWWQGTASYEWFQESDEEVVYKIEMMGVDL